MEDFLDPTIIGAFITALGALGAVFLKKKYDQKTCKFDPIKEDVNQNASVYTALNYTLEKTNADRCYVFQFHNGGRYYSGRGEQKFSCTHEVIKHGISRECANLQGLRVSNFHYLIDTLVNDEKFSFYDVSKIEDYSYLSFLRERGIEGTYNCLIKTLNGKLIGVLSLDYVKEGATESGVPVKFDPDAKSKLDDEEFHLLMKRQAKIISGYLV